MKGGKKPKKRTIFVCFCIAAIIIFTAVCFVFAWCEKSLSDVLIERYFKAFTIELALLFGIEVKSND